MKYLPGILPSSHVAGDHHTMSNPKSKSPAVQKSLAKDRAVNTEPPTYSGKALATQSPEKKLTRAQQLDEVQEQGLNAFASLAKLLDGEPPLPLVQKAYYIIDKAWKKPVDAMRKSINETLKQFMREHVEAVTNGEVTQEVSKPLTELQLDIGGETFKSERTVQRHTMGNAPDMADVRLLAEKLGLDDHLKLCNEVISYEYNQQTAVAMVKSKFPKVDAEKFIDNCRAQKSESLSIEKV